MRVDAIKFLVLLWFPPPPRPISLLPAMILFRPPVSFFYWDSHRPLPPSPFLLLLQRTLLTVANLNGSSRQTVQPNKKNQPKKIQQQPTATLAYFESVCQKILKSPQTKLSQSHTPSPPPLLPPTLRCDLLFVGLSLLFSTIPQYPRQLIFPYFIPLPSPTPPCCLIPQAACAIPDSPLFPPLTRPRQGSVDRFLPSFPTPPLLSLLFFHVILLFCLASLTKKKQEKAKRTRAHTAYGGFKKNTPGCTRTAEECCGDGSKPSKKTGKKGEKKEI